MKIKTMIILVLGVVILIACGVFFMWHVVFSKSQNPSLTQSQIRVGVATFTVEMATTTFEKARGLSFRPNLAEGSGMLFTFSSGVHNFWMKDMNFPIDIIWISGDKVAGIAQDALPQPGAHWWELTIYTSPDGVDKVLEVNAGVVAKDNIVVGSPVVFGEGTSGN